MKSVTKRPTESFAEIIKIARLCSAAVGCDVSDPNFRITWLTVVVISLIIAYFIFTFFTISKLITEDWKVLLEAGCMMGTVLQGVTKLISGFAYHKRFADMRLLFEGIYEKYEQRNVKYRTVLQESCDRVWKITKIVGVNYVMAVSGICLVPFILMATRGQRYLMMHFHVPGLDLETNHGYYGTLTLQMVCVVCGGFGLFAGDILPLIYLMQSILFVDIFKLKIEELNQMLDDVEYRTSRSVVENFADIVQWHQLYLQFTKICNKICYYIVTVQVITSAVSIVLTIFILLTSDWPVVYPYFILTIYTLYVYCILGTKIETCNDQFTVEIYNISWYNMTASHQKLVRLMVMKSQSPYVLDVAGVMPLSVSTALQITKTIYSISMLMVQFLNE